MFLFKGKASVERLEIIRRIKEFFSRIGDYFVNLPFKTYVNSFVCIPLTFGIMLSSSIFDKALSLYAGDKTKNSLKRRFFVLSPAVS